MPNPVLLGANNAPQAQSMMTALVGLTENGGRVGQVPSDRKVFTPITAVAKKEVSTPQVLLAKVVGGDSVSGYSVDLYPEGPLSKANGGAIVYVTESNLQLNRIYTGAWILVQKTALTVVGN